MQGKRMEGGEISRDELNRRMKCGTVKSMQNIVTMYSPGSRQAGPSLSFHDSSFG